MVRHSRILCLLLCLLVLVVIMVFGLVRQAATPEPTSPPAHTTTPISTPAPTTTPFVPVVEPSTLTPWVKSDIGPVYAQETQYVKPSPDGRYLYIYNMDTRNIIVLDIYTCAVVQNIKMLGFWAQASEMIFSSDGQWMYTLSAGHVGTCDIVVIDTKTQKIARLIPLPKEYKGGFAENGPFIAISPDERFLYVPANLGIYRVNIESEEVVKISDIGRVVCLAFTSEGKHLLGTNILTDSLDIIDPVSG